MLDERIQKRRNICRIAYVPYRGLPHAFNEDFDP